MKLERRTFLALASSAPLLLLGNAPAQTNACYDPSALPLSQRSRRRSLNYQDVSSDPVKHCSACSFFKSAAPGCGTCQMLSGGPVNAGAVCNSFAPAPR